MQAPRRGDKPGGEGLHHVRLGAHTATVRNRLTGTARALRAVLAILVLAALLVSPSSARACSPPFEEPTIRALGPDQVVLVGTIGEKVAGGRLFHVERWFSGGVPGTPVLIAFKEGEPVGDCSYPVQAGQHLLIAPYADAAGRLSADLATLQADPDTPDGRRYVAEAVELFGPGVVPPVIPPVVEIASPPPEPVDGTWMAGVALGIAAIVALLFGLVIVAARRGSPGA
jgi:hypothetical protein